MKTNLNKTLFVAISWLMCIVLFLGFSLSTFISTASASAEAEEDELIELSEDEMENLKEVLSEFETYFDENEISVEVELNNFLSEYADACYEWEENLLNEDEDEEGDDDDDDDDGDDGEEESEEETLVTEQESAAERVAWMEEVVQELVDTYYEEDAESIVTPSALIDIFNYYVQRQLCIRVITAIVCYYTVFGYVLASELLLKSYYNRKKSLVYSPTFGYIVKKSDTFTDIAYDDTTKSGSGEFVKDDTRTGNDLYYAIHNFDFSKSSKRSKKVTITDTYNFDYDNTNYSIEGIAVNTMYYYQQKNIIIPYKVKIVQTAD